MDQPLPPGILLDLVEPVQQLMGSQQRPHSQTAIQEIILLHAAVGSGNQIIGYFQYLAAGRFRQGFDCTVQICLFVSHIGAKGDAGGVPCSGDRDRYSLQRKSHRGPGLFQLQGYGLQMLSGEQQLLHQLFSCCLDQLIGMLLKKFCDLLADDAVMDGFCQIVCYAGCSRIGIKYGAYEKFLPQFVFLWKNTMMGKDFQIFDGDFIVLF